MNVGAARRVARARLAVTTADGGADAERLRDADRIVGLALAWPAARVMAFDEVEMSTDCEQRLVSLVARRRAGEPFAYLCGEKEFFGLALSVSNAVLVPRPETELLVEIVLAALPPDARTIADLGTGSGAVALALARHRPAWQVLAIDDCPAALAVAACNRARHSLANVHLVRGDWTAALADDSLDAIVANPPYVADGDPHLPALAHEPAHALIGGVDGLAAIRSLLADVPRALRRGGFVAIEHGATQGCDVRGLLASHGFSTVATHRDLAGHDRVSSAWRN